MSDCIAVANQKGGVAKTTTVLNLGYTLSELGYKVLLVDIDPQSNLTMCLGVDKPEELETTIYHLMTTAMKDEELPDKSKYMLTIGKIDLIPCSIELTAVELELVNAISREFVLKNILAGVKTEYDYIIIDTAPSLGLLTLNAFTACDSVLITATPQYLSAKGLEMLIRNIARVKKWTNPDISIKGILLTMCDTRMNLYKEVYAMIKDAYGKHIRIYENVIPVSVKVGEANLYGRSIIEYQPDNKVAAAYRAFTKELVSSEG
jgi:chromosome partitioning protein